MGGDLVRVDFPDPNILAYGIVAPDRSSAIYTVASIGQSEVMLPGRLRFPGWIRTAATESGRSWSEARRQA